MQKSVLFIIIILSFTTISSVMKDDGRAGVTGSPGETTCNTTNCHTGNQINSPGGTIQINAPTLTNWEYVPGQVYPIEVTISRTGNSLFGFGFEALRSTGANGGTLSITNPSQTQIKSAVVGGNLRTNVVHQLNGGASVSQHTFTFNWTAPASGTGNVTFYTAGNAANGNGSTSGDFIYNTSQVVTQSTVGLNDLNYVFNNLNIYPIPASDQINIEFKAAVPSIVELSLVDLNGKVIRTLQSKINSGEQHLVIPLDHSIKNGLYFVHLISEDTQTSKRILVVR